MKKRKKKRFSAVKEVKAMSRERVGKLPSAQVIPDPRFKPEKHPKRIIPEDE